MSAGSLDSDAQLTGHAHGCTASQLPLRASSNERLLIVVCLYTAATAAAALLTTSEAIIACENSRDYRERWDGAAERRGSGKGTNLALDPLPLASMYPKQNEASWGRVEGQFVFVVNFSQLRVWLSVVTAIWKVY